MLTRDFVGGVASIAIGAVYLFFAYQLRTSALDDSMGPGGLPRVYGWMLVGLGVILTAQAIVSRRMAVADGEKLDGEKGEDRRRHDPKAAPRSGENRIIR